MELITMRDLFKNTKEYVGKSIEVGGWVRSIRASKTFGFPGRGWYSQAHGPSRLLMGTGRHSEGSEPYASTPFPIDSFRVHQLHLGARKLMQRPRPHAGTWSGGDFK